MKAGTIRKLANEHSAEALESAIEALVEGEPLPITVDGEDDGERLTHVNLALRIRRRADSGEDLKVVFRDVMAQVRGLLQNES